MYGIKKKKHIFFFADRNLAACQRKICSMNIFKKARHRRHFWAFGLSFKEHCFHEFESNLKTRHYEYALDFLGYCIYSCVSMLSFLYITFFPERQYLSFLEKRWLFLQVYIFCMFTWFCIVSIFYFSLFLFIYLCFFIWWFFWGKSIFPYFRGNSLNSKAGLGFKEFWFVSTIMFKNMLKISVFFSKKHRGKNKTH